MTTTRTAAPPLLAALGLALTLTACADGDPATGAGGGEATGAAGGSEELTTVKLSTLPIAASQAVDVGIEEGIFADHGLELDMSSGQGGGATLPAVTTGSIDMAIGNPISVLLAESQGIDLRLVAGYSNSRTETPDTTAVVVPEGSEIQDAADLSGRTVAVNTLVSGGDMNTMEAVALAGGDPQSVEFVEIPFQDSLPQLDAGNVDAAWLVEPFLSQALAEGNRVASWIYLDSVPAGQPTMIVYSSPGFVDENPEVVEAFRVALDETLVLVQEDPDLLRDLLPQAMQMPAEVAANLQLDEFSAQLDVEGARAVADLMFKHGLSATEPDVDALLGE